MKKTNFDRYLEDQMRDPTFAARFKNAGEAWEAQVRVVFEPEGKNGRSDIPSEAISRRPNCRKQRGA